MPPTEPLPDYDAVLTVVEAERIVRSVLSGTFPRLADGYVINAVETLPTSNTARQAYVSRIGELVVELTVSAKAAQTILDTLQVPA